MLKTYSKIFALSLVLGLIAGVVGTELATRVDNYLFTPPRTQKASFFFPERWWVTLRGSSCGVPANIDAFVTCWTAKTKPLGGNPSKG